MADTFNPEDNYPGFNKLKKRVNFTQVVSAKSFFNPDRWELEENFMQKPGINADITIDPDADDAGALAAFVIANRNFEVLGTNGVTASVTFPATVAGILLTTAGANNDQVIIAPHLDTAQTNWAKSGQWGTENEVIWECVIRVGASLANITMWAGLKLTNTPVIATDADQAFFRFAAADSNTEWQCISSIANSDTTTSSGVTVAVSTNYYFRIEIDAARRAHFFINDKEVTVTAALTNDVSFIPYVGVMETDAGGGAKTLGLIKEKISRVIFESS